MIKLLSKLPFFGRAISFVTGNVRLVIEYALIATLLVTAGATITMWLQKNGLVKENVALSGRVTEVEAVNERQNETISTLKGLREKDAKALTTLVKQYETLAARDLESRTKVHELEKINASVRKYLDQPVPAELARLLDAENHNGASGGNGTPAGIPAGNVQASYTSKNPDKQRPRN